MAAELPANVVAGIPERFEAPIVLFRSPPAFTAWRLYPLAEVRRVVHGSDGRLSTADLTVRIDDAIRVQGEGATLEVGDRAFPALLNSQIVVADLPRTRAGTRGRTRRLRVLFDGFAGVSEAGWGGAPDDSAESITIHATCVLQTWDHDERAQVYGRWMRRLRHAKNLDAKDETTWTLGQGPGGTLQRVASLPCVFNTDGKPNMARQPVRLPQRNSGSGSEGKIDVPVFVDDDAPGAMHWSVGNVLRYLLWFHRPTNGLIDSDDVLALTDALVRKAPVASGGLSLDAILQMRATDVRTEAVSLLNAMRLLFDAAGLHFSVDYDLFHNKLNIWSAAEPLTEANEHTAKWFYLEAPGTDQSGRTRAEVLARNNIDQAHLLIDYDSVRNRVKVLGAAKRYTMRVDLVPGWRPESDLDNVAAGQPVVDAEAKALFDEPGRKLDALDPQQRAWFDKYVRQNPDEKFRARVGRWWVLREHGGFPAADFARSVGPFLAGRYAPFDFASAIEGVQPGDWAMFRRRFLPLPVDRRVVEQTGPVNPHLAIAQVVIEVSFDGGSTYTRPKQLTARVMADQCGIAIDTPWLTSITEPGVEPATTNLWYAIIRGDARVRVTAIVIGDDRIEGTADAQFSPYTGSPRVALVDAGDRFRHRRVSGTSAGKPRGGTISEPDALDLDESREADAFGQWFVGQHQDRRFAVRASIPGRIDTYYKPGDRIQGVAGRDVRFDRVIDQKLVVPTVIGVAYEIAPGGVTTTVILEDWRGAPELAAEQV